MLQHGGPDHLTIKVPSTCSTAVVQLSLSGHLAVTWWWLSSLCSFRGDGEFTRQLIHQPPADPAALLPCGVVVYDFTYQCKITEESVMGRGGP